MNRALTWNVGGVSKKCWGPSWISALHVTHRPTVSLMGHSNSQRYVSCLHLGFYLHLAKFTYNNSYHSNIGMAPCQSPVYWLEPKDLIIEDILDNNEKIHIIQEHLRYKPLEFKEGDYILLRESPPKVIMHFRIKGKLALRYIRPFQIVQRVGVVAYHLALPPELSHIRNVFYVSMHHKCQPDPMVWCIDPRGHIIRGSPCSDSRPQDEELMPLWRFG